MLPSGSDFYIAALPRSRTAWLSNLLCTPKSFCFHEALARYGEIPRRGEIYLGSAETCVDLIPTEKSPRIVSIHRNIGESYESLISQFQIPKGISKRIYERELLKVLKINANYLNKMKGLHINFHEIDDRIEEIWEHLLPDVPVDTGRIKEMQRLNIQLEETDLVEIM